MKLSELRRVLPDAAFLNLTNREIRGVTDDSRQVQDGWLFVAVRGVFHDGHQYIGEAVARGAGAVVAEEKCIAAGGLPQLIVADTRLAVAEVAAAFYGHPSHDITVSAVTGTDGKSSIATIGAAIASAAGKRVGVIGTICYLIGDRRLPAKETTPGAVDLQSLLAQMRDDRVDMVFMEASSHGLHQRRTHAIRLASAVHSVVSEDHMDYHASPAEYCQAKARLFESLEPAAFAVLNADDVEAHDLFESVTQASVVSYGVDRPADYRAVGVECKLDGARFGVETPSGAVEIVSRLVGRHNVQNCLAAAANLHVLGLGLDAIKAGIESMHPVPGRLERVGEPGDPVVLIDYAHTAHALESVLGTLAQLATGRILLVFGCGGDRDKSKRPRMGRIASEHADLVWVTSDNPRSESPESIMEDILRGVAEPERFNVQPDRGLAIDAAVAEARPGDVVLVAGKGHETQQIFKDHVIPFSDAQVARRALAKRRRVAATCQA